MTRKEQVDKLISEVGQASIVYERAQDVCDSLFCQLKEANTLRDKAYQDLLSLEQELLRLLKTPEVELENVSNGS